MSYILSLDAGTSSVRAVVFDHDGRKVSEGRRELTQFYPDHGHVEHNPAEIWNRQTEVITEALERGDLLSGDIEGIGITNQRETTIIWERGSSKPIWNAIVWQDDRTKGLCESLRQAKGDTLIKKRTGLHLHPYFSATKIAWILDHVEGAREKAKRKELCFGTVNTWLLWNLTKGEVFATDVSNASRTLLYNIHDNCWDEELLEYFDIPKEILPEVRSSSEVYGHTNCEIISHKLPIASMVGDQSAALFGQTCFTKSDIECTFGTGCFVMMNTGTKPVISRNHLLTTLAWQLKDEKPVYALEGTIFSGGAVVNWLKDAIGIIKSTKEIELLAHSVPDSGGVYFVPALHGLAAPHWDAKAKGTLFGLSSSSNIGHIARATLEGIAQQVAELIELMKKDAKITSKEIKVGGGMSENNLLMQLQSDLLGELVSKPKEIEVTSLGAAYLAGLAVGFWKDLNEIKSLWKLDRHFEPQMSKKDTKKMQHDWQAAIKSTESWSERDEAI